MNILGQFDWHGGVILTGSRIIAQGFYPGGQSATFDNEYQMPARPLPPDRFPQEVRDALTTRRQLSGEPITRPIINEGFIYEIDQAERVLAAAMRTIRPRSWRRWLKPTVIATGRIDAWESQKRVILDCIERAGARRVFLVEYPMACAVGVDADGVASKSATGLLALEADWFEYGTIAYGDMITSASTAVGINDLVDELQWYLADQREIAVEPEDLRQYLSNIGLSVGGQIQGKPLAGTSTEAITIDVKHGEFVNAGRIFLRRVSEVILRSLADLTDGQMQDLVIHGIKLTGDTVNIPGFALALTGVLGITVSDVATVDGAHPAIAGLRFYADHLQEWAKSLTPRKTA